VSTSAPPQHQALRPSSPITTLKQSIQAAEAKLNETRNRGKKSKKDQRAGHADVKREINTLKSKLESSGGTDDKQERRLQQINQHKAQADDAAADFKTRLAALGEVPKDQLAEYEVKRSNHQSATNAKRNATRELDNCKAGADRELSAMRSEIQQTGSKREKLAARNSQRSQDLEKLREKQKADMTAKQRREYDREQIKHHREQERSSILDLLNGLDNELQTYAIKTRHAYQQIAGPDSWTSAQPPPYPGYSSPPTPENFISGMTNGSLGSPHANGFPMVGQQPFHSPFHSAQASLSNTHAIAPRGRSSSMLSQYSGFTDNGEEYNFAPEQARHQNSFPMATSVSAGAVMQVHDDRKESEGSGSASLANGSTGSNSPRPDAWPFVPGKNASAVGVIGPPGKTRAPQSPAHASLGSGR